MKIYGGLIDRVPDEDIGKSNILIKRVSCVDYSSLFDNENVVDTFADMYAREIIGRVLYKFTARDQETQIIGCESSEIFTISGTARSPSYSSINIDGNNSLQI